ncbi:MAG: hypothetical protein ACRDGQ_07080 [Candidatus Limnocylindrales bacterium]
MDERRLRRAESQRVFDTMAVDYVDRPGVSRAAMFGSLGLKAGGRFFAFVGGEGQLVVKLPAHEASGLVEAGRATAVRAGRNPTREWVSLAWPTDGAAGEWSDVLAAAYRYAVSLT